jgi:hypothetical protein
VFIVSIIFSFAAAPVLAEYDQLAAAIAIPVVLFALAIYLTFGLPDKPFPATHLRSGESFRASLKPYIDLHGALPSGLLLAPEVAARPERTLPRGPMHAVVVTTSPLAIDALRINDVANRHGVGLLCLHRLDERDAPAILERLRASPDLPILLLHDASPEGCLLIDDLPARLGLRADHRIVDLGLFPRRSIAKKRLCLGVPIDSVALARLRSRAALPPAPAADTPRARALRPRRAVLTAAELTWLATGRMTPIESLMPRDLIQRVTAAVTRLAPGESADRAAVRNFGFMTKPPASPA